MWCAFWPGLAGAGGFSVMGLLLRAGLLGTRFLLLTLLLLLLFA